jgi:hypothetical protein
MPTKDQVLALLRQGASYDAIGAQLGIPPGQAYLIATGLPADGGAVVTAEQRQRPGELRSGADRLVNPRVVNPTARGDVREWVRRRAYTDTTMQQARRGSVA